MRWVALLCGMLICLGCPKATPPSLEEGPEVFLHKVEVRMQAGLDMLYFSAVVEQYYDLCTVLYPVLTKTLAEGYGAFRQRNVFLCAPGGLFCVLQIPSPPLKKRGKKGFKARGSTRGIPARVKSRGPP